MLKLDSSFVMLFMLFHGIGFLPYIMDVLNYIIFLLFGLCHLLQHPHVAGQAGSGIGFLAFIMVINGYA